VEQSVRSVGVLDKSVALLRALAGGPMPLAGLAAATGIPKPTAHRLAVALCEHGLLRRTDDGGFALGAELVGLGRAAAEGWPWGTSAGPALAALVEATGESAQLYVREGDARRCLLSRESTHELRTIVAEGARLPLDRGSAGRILSAAGSSGSDGWVESVEDRAPGVASVSAPVRDAGGAVVAAVGISGPVDRLGPTPGERFGPAVVAAAARISSALG
jgi:DNA-binding IclR family transcriptional regulator